MYRAVVLAWEMYTHLVPDRRIRATIKSRLDERIRTNTLKASADTFKVIETIDDRVGSYNFLPTLIESCSRRKQCPLYSTHPMGITESSFFGCAGNDRCIKGWSRGAMQPPHHKPIDSARVGTGQSRRRGRVRCQSHFIAWERRRREPGSNSVIITIALTRDEGHVVGLGGLQRVRKIFVGCPAIRPIWDQSPGRTASRFETVGNRLYPLHDQDCLRRFTAEAQIQDRSRAKTGPNTAPAFSRVWHSNRLPHHPPTPNRTPSTAGQDEDRPRIPVVDNDPQTLRCVRDVLSKAGYWPIVTADPEEVPRLMEDEEPRLVLLDLMLPGTDGIIVMKSIHDVADVPIIFLSAYGQDQVIARAFEMGAADYVVKPFSPTELVARIHAALRSPPAAPRRPSHDFRQPGREPYEFGEIVIDFERRTTTLGGLMLKLTPT